MTTHQTTAALAYQLRINLFGVSPPIWRRVRVSFDTTIADLHNIIQIAMGWEDIHLHEFCIRGHAYGVRQIGAVSHFAGPANLTLSAFELPCHERFTYEYDFYSCWLHEIRVEKIVSGLEAPVCISGKGASPPEDTGPPERFMQRKDARFVEDLIETLKDELDAADFSRDRVIDLAVDWLPWLQSFDRKSVNQRLQSEVYNG